MNRRTKWLLGALIMLALLPLIWRGLEAYDYANADEITRTGIDTDRVLARYEKSGDGDELRRWITDGPTEAPGSQRDFILGRWAQGNPTEFAAVINKMTKQEREVFFEHFLPSLVGSDFDKSRFADAFRPHNSPAVTEMIGHLNGTITPQKW